jgi:hypothetical protein
MSSVVGFDMPEYAMSKHGRRVGLEISRPLTPEECWFIRTSRSSPNIGSAESGGPTRSLGLALFLIGCSNASVAILQDGDKIESVQAGVAQWQSVWFPTKIRGFDSLHPLSMQLCFVFDREVCFAGAESVRNPFYDLAILGRYRFHVDVRHV